MGDTAMSDMELIFLGALVMAGAIFVLAVIIFPLWFVLHRVLSPLDGALLREPFFQKSEQLNCLVWPFSYWKTLIYIGLIAAPSISRRTRFKGLEEAPTVGKVTDMACKVQFWLMASCGIIGLIWFAYLVWGAYIYPRM